MNNKVLRVIGICAGTALLGLGLGGCSSSEKAKDGLPVDQVVAEVNAAQANGEQQQEQASGVQQLRSQMQKGLGTDVYPQAVWEAIADGKMLPVHLVPMTGAVKIAQQELRNQPGYTDADIKKWLAEQVAQGSLRDVDFSSATLDFWRLQKFSISVQEHKVPQDLAQQVFPKISKAFNQGLKQGEGTGNNKMLDQVLRMQTGVPVLAPSLGAGVKLQGLANAEQALQSQMQQGTQPAK